MAHMDHADAKTARSLKTVGINSKTVEKMWFIDFDGQKQLHNWAEIHYVTEWYKQYFQFTVDYAPLRLH